MNILFKTIFGSNLYGTNTISSDTDFKGVYLPTKEDCFLNRISKSIVNKTNNSNNKNNKDDIDEEYYSLQYFFKLAEQGEMCVIDMIHSPYSKWIIKSDIWCILYANRFRFHSKNMKAYLGYIKTQTAKYGVKGSRLASIENFINILNKEKSYNKLSEVWDKLPIDEYTYPVQHIVNPNIPTLKHYECCGKMITETVTIEYALLILNKIYTSYGVRAQKAKNNECIDWKAVSHAFRAGYQIKEILKTNDLIYPLKEASELIKIKNGEYHYINDSIAQKLEDIIIEVNELIKISKLPDKIDVK